VGDALGDVAALPGLVFGHLQGVSVAAIIVFSLFCISRVSQGLIREYRL
jgi:hypothetical protein